MDVGTLTGKITLEDQMTAVLAKLDQGLKIVDESLQITNAGVQKLAQTTSTSATAAEFFGNVLATTFMKVTSFVKNLVSESLMAGVRLEQLGIATRFLGERAGYSGAFIDDLAKKIEATGISGIASREAIQSLLGAQVKLEHATRLSAIAQNMQSISGRSSSEVFQVMTRALATGNTQLLRGIGFQNINLRNLKAQAAATGETATATSGSARTQMILNAILAEGNRNLGLYNESMKSAGKQLSSSERAWAQVSEQIGVILTPIVSVAIKTWYSLGQAVRDSVTSAQESLKPFVTAIAEFFQTTVDNVKNFDIGDVFENVKTKIVDLWNWLVDFNDRWQITTVIVGGAKLAWEALKGAFELVERAVKAVMSAWQSMPVWLQSITRATFEASLAMSAYTVVLGAVATPITAIVQKLDLYINTLSNTVSGIFSVTQLTEKWAGPVEKVTKVYTGLTTAITTNTIAVKTANFVAESWGLGQKYLIDQLGRLNKAIVASTVVQSISATTTKILTAVKGYWLAAVAALSINYDVLIVKLGIASTAMTVQTRLAGFATTAMTALGVAMHAVLLVLAPIAAFWAGWKLGEWTREFESVQRAMIWLDERLGRISKEAAQAKREMLEMMKEPIRTPRTGWFSSDESVRAVEKAALETAINAKMAADEIDAFTENAVRSFMNLKDNGATAVGALAAQLDGLQRMTNAPLAAFKKLAEEAANLADQGAELPEGLQQLITLVPRDRMGPPSPEPGGPDPVTEAAAAQAKKIEDMVKGFRKGEESLTLFGAAFDKLTASERETFAIQERVVPQILKLAAAGHAVTPAMEKVVHAHQAERAALIEKDAATLASSNLTLESIESMKRAGMTLDDIAFRYGAKLPGSIERYIASLEKQREAEAGLAAFMAATRAAAAADEERERQRKQGQSDAIIAAEKRHDELIRERTVSTTQLKLDAIDRELNAEILAYSQKGLMSAELEKQLRATAEVKKIDIIDQDELAQWVLFANLATEAKMRVKAMDEAAREAAYGGLADFFTQLGQISGSEGIGKFFTSIGSLVIGLQSADRWARETGANGQKLGGSFGALSVIFNNNATKSQRFAAGLQSIAGIAQGVTNVIDATSQSATRMGNAFNGAMAGAQAGAMFGPMGVAIGAAAGFVTGLIRGKPAWAKAIDEIGRDFGKGIGEKISKELAERIAQQSKNLFKGDRATAITYNLPEIIAEAGGLTPENVDMFTAKLRDVFVHYSRGAMTAAQATEVLNKSFSAFLAASTDEAGRWSFAFKDIIFQAKQHNLETKEMREAQQQQALIAIAGFNSIVSGTKRAMEGYANLKKAVDEATEAGDYDRLTAALTAQHAASEAAAGPLKDLGTIATSVFAAAMDTGATFAQAIEAAQPGVKALKKAYEDLGMSVEDPFMKLLFVHSQVLDQAPELLQAAGGLQASLIAMGNLNMINAESFGAFGRTAFDVYTRLQDQVAKAGGTTKDALLPMQAYLQEAAAKAKEFGIPLDDNTQMLIDQSRELGIWKEKGLSATEKMTQSTDRLTAAIDKMTNALLGIPDELPNPFEGWEMPEVPRVDVGDPDRGRPDFREIENGANRAAEAVDHLNFGYSPGGLKEIPILFNKGAKAAAEFADDTRQKLEGTSGIIDVITDSSDLLVKSFEGAGREVGEVSHHMREFAGYVSRVPAEFDAVHAATDLAGVKLELLSETGEVTATMVGSAAERIADRIRGVGNDTDRLIGKVGDDLVRAIQYSGSEVENVADRMVQAFMRVLKTVEELARAITNIPSGPIGPPKSDNPGGGGDIIFRPPGTVAPPRGGIRTAVAAEIPQSIGRSVETKTVAPVHHFYNNFIVLPKDADEDTIMEVVTKNVPEAARANAYNFFGARLAGAIGVKQQ